MRDRRAFSVIQVKNLFWWISLLWDALLKKFVNDVLIITKDSFTHKDWIHFLWFFKLFWCLLYFAIVACAVHVAPICADNVSLNVYVDVGGDDAIVVIVKVILLSLVVLLAILLSH